MSTGGSRRAAIRASPPRIRTTQNLFALRREPYFHFVHPRRRRAQELLATEHREAQRGLARLKCAERRRGDDDVGPVAKEPRINHVDPIHVAHSPVQNHALRALDELEEDAVGRLARGDYIELHHGIGLHRAGNMRDVYTLYLNEAAVDAPCSERHVNYCKGQDDPAQQHEDSRLFMGGQNEAHGRRLEVARIGVNCQPMRPDLRRR